MIFPPPRLRDRLLIASPILAVLAVVLALIGACILLARERAATQGEADRLQERVVFVRMPGRPLMCVAALPGHRGYGPTFLGADACAWVRGRVVSDEDLAWHLRDYVITRIRGTDTCLAHAAEGTDDFTLPCEEDD